MRRSRGLDPAPVAQGDPVLVDDRHLGAEGEAHALALEAADRGALQRRREGAEHGVAPLDDDDVHLAEVEVGEVLAEDEVDELAHRPGELDAGGATAHQDHGVEASPGHRVLGPGGALEAGEQVVADRQRLAERLEAVGVLLRRVHPEVVVHGPGGDDEVVVVEVARGGVEAARLEVDTGHPRQPEGHVAATPHRRTHRVRDLRRVEQRGRHLVEQRLEEVDEDHVDGHVAQRPGGGETAETGAEHHHPRPGPSHQAGA